MKQAKLATLWVAIRIDERDGTEDVDLNTIARSKSRCSQTVNQIKAAVPEWHAKNPVVRIVKAKLVEEP